MEGEGIGNEGRKRVKGFVSGLWYRMLPIFSFLVSGFIIYIYIEETSFGLGLELMWAWVDP